MSSGKKNMGDDTSQFLIENQGGTVIRVYVQPRASKNELAGVHEGSLKVRLTAPPIEGKANKECISFLAKLFNVPKSSIEILQGQKSRHKKFLLRGLPTKKAARLLSQSNVF